MKLLPLLLAASLVGSIAHATLAPSPEAAHPLAAGAKAPDAEVIGLNGKPLKLSEAIGGKPTILIFFRGGWCPFCSRHLAALGEHELDLRGLGYQILGISAEGPEKLAPTAEANHVRYRLLSDPAAKASQAYGVAYRLSSDTGKAYRGNGIELTPAPDGDGYWLPVPTAFIVDHAGVIRFVYSNSDPSIRISPEELLAAAKAAAQK
jgi:peroxiredoxin